MSALLFVYGTLKRGCSNHRQMGGLTFVGAARTQPGFRLYDVGGFPGLVAAPDDRDGVHGEVWSVDAAGLARLDRFEGVAEGLYRREAVPMAAPFAAEAVDAYVFGSGVAGRAVIGSEWREQR